MDLVAGRYPIFAEKAALNGVTTYQDLRESIDRRDIVTNATLTSGTMYLVAVICQPGDIIGAVNIAVQTASATPTHGWAALYTGVGTSATLITQSADNTSGFVGTGAAQKFTLATPYEVGGFPGTPQGGGAASSATSGAPVVLGVALFNQATTGGKLDGMTGGSVAGQVVVTGQVAIVSTQTGVTGATAPSTLASVAAAAGFVPYIALSRS